MDQGSNKNHSPAYNFTPTVTKFCVMWEGLSLPHDTKFGNCRCKIVDSRSFHSWSLIHGLRWSGLIKAAPGSVCIQCNFRAHVFIWQWIKTWFRKGMWPVGALYQIAAWYRYIDIWGDRRAHWFVPFFAHNIFRSCLNPCINVAKLIQSLW